jgi:predicted DNA-binding transcriptional regulator YafY
MNDRLKRILEILRLLQEGTGYDVESLANACGVHRRTILRDIKLIRERLDFDIEFDKNRGRYRMHGAFFIPPAQFTLEEALALVVLCHELGGRDAIPFFEAARSAATKLQGMLPLSLRKNIQELSDTVRIQTGPKNRLEGSEPFFVKLNRAVASQQCVRITYQSPTEEGTIQTRISPYQLFFTRRSWYVIGRSSIHRSVRTFHVGRILGLQELEDSFKIPSGFTLKRYLRNAWHMIPESGPDSEVLIRFSPMVATNVAEVAWHPTQRTQFADDGSLLYRATVSGLHEISWWILGYGDKAEALQPPELRRIVASAATRMAQIYQGVPSDF